MTKTKPWIIGEWVGEGDERQHRGKVYKCKMYHPTKLEYEPRVTPVYWELIGENK
jgi:hypothetical protein